MPRPSPKKRSDSRQEEPNSRAPLGQGGRFEALKQKLSRKGVRDPGALAASIGRKKYGKARFQKLAARGA